MYYIKRSMIIGLTVIMISCITSTIVKVPESYKFQEKEQVWSFTGNYEMEDGMVLHLKQEGMKATGNYRLTNLSCFVKGNRVDCKLFLNELKVEKSFYLIMSDDGKYLKGLNWAGKRIGEPMPVNQYLADRDQQSRVGQTNEAVHPMSVSGVEFGRYYALVIGINQYSHLPGLRTAENDARAVADILGKEYSFDAKLMLNPTRAVILDTLNQYRKFLTAQDNLLLYYAGHGWLDEQADEGYWMPVDATKGSEVNWISNSTITSTIRAMRAKHVIVIADSCYSGKLARGLHISQKAPNYLARISQKKARVVLSSGGLEPVADSGGKGSHSIFASAFIEALSENNDVLDGTSLFTRIRERVGWNADQTPEYANIHKAGHDGGDFLFVKQKNE